MSRDGPGAIFSLSGGRPGERNIYSPNSPKRAKLMEMNDLTPIQQDFPEVPGTPSPNLGQSIDSIRDEADEQILGKDMLILGDAIEFVGGEKYAVGEKTKQYPWWLGPHREDGRGGVTKGVYLDENEGEPPVKVKWNNGRTYWVHYQDIRRDASNTRKLNRILQRTWSNDSRPFGNPEDSDGRNREERIFGEILNDAEADKEIAASIQQMYKKKLAHEAKQDNMAHDLLDCYGAELSMKCIFQTVLLTAVYANDMFFNTFCIYLVILGCRSQETYYVYGLLGVNWYLTLWFVIYYLTVTDNNLETIYNPLTSSESDLASVITSRYFPLLAIFGIVAVPLGIVAIPVLISSKILDARRSGSGALAHSIQMAICAWSFAIVFVYLFTGLCLLFLVLAVTALSFSSFPLLVYSSCHGKYACHRVFLYENIFRFLVSCAYAMLALSWIPSADQDDWWITVIIATGLLELGCIYYRYAHIKSNYKERPNVKIQDEMDLESVDCGLGSVHVNRDHDPNYPTALVYHGTHQN